MGEQRAQKAGESTQREKQQRLEVLRSGVSESQECPEEERRLR